MTRRPRVPLCRLLPNWRRTAANFDLELSAGRDWEYVAYPSVCSVPLPTPGGPGRLLCQTPGPGPLFNIAGCLRDVTAITKSYVRRRRSHRPATPLLYLPDAGPSPPLPATLDDRGDVHLLHGAGRQRAEIGVRLFRKSARSAQRGQATQPRWRGGLRSTSPSCRSCCVARAALTRQTWA